jgi:hypothetical protein
MVQIVEGLLSKHKALSSTPNTTKKIRISRLQKEDSGPLPSFSKYS